MVFNVCYTYEWWNRTLSHYEVFYGKSVGEHLPIIHPTDRATLAFIWGSTTGHLSNITLPLFCVPSKTSPHQSSKHLKGIYSLFYPKQHRHLWLRERFWVISSSPLTVFTFTKCFSNLNVTKSQSPVIYTPQPSTRTCSLWLRSHFMDRTNRCLWR